jgi:hypothetical protein
LRGWSLSPRHWRLLVASSTPSISQLNTRWAVNWNAEQWQRLWRQLWSGWAHPRTKFLLRRLIQYGFFTQSRGAIWKVCTAQCPICCTSNETMFHLFFHCSFVYNRWRQIFHLLQGTSLNFDSVHTPLQLVHCAIQSQKQSPVRMIVLAEVLWTSWCERNRHVFQENTSRTPVSVILVLIIQKVEALHSRIRSLVKQRRLKSDQTVLEQILANLRQPDGSALV